jgi:hypothetical protein
MEFASNVVKSNLKGSVDLFIAQLLETCEPHCRPSDNEKGKTNEYNHSRQKHRTMKVQTRKYVPGPDVVRIRLQCGVRGTPEL